MTDPHSASVPLEQRLLLFPKFLIHAEVVAQSVMLLLNRGERTGLAPHPARSKAQGVMPLGVYGNSAQLAGVEWRDYQSNSTLS